MTTITITNGRSFESEPGEVLLDAAKRGGVTIGYSCRTGRCSSCKSKVISGTTSRLQDELGLNADEKTAGWILSCVRTAESDLAIEVDDLGELALPEVKTLPCRIQAIDKLAHDVLKVILRLPPNTNFSFHPGQYIDVLGPGGLRRSYSLANAPHAAKLLELHIRAVPGGLMSEYWFSQAKMNDLLRLNGPLGTFFLRGCAGMDVIFLATGTGIAPVKAMLEGIDQLPAEERPRSVQVYWGGRTLADHYLDVASIPNAGRYIPVLSRAADDWLGARGHVQEVLMAEVADFSNALVYACGSDLMIHGARSALIGAGLPARRFFSDAFVSSASVAI
jgi:CDP-4-dehydro-6-deoxyglucose reductase